MTAAAREKLLVRVANLDCESEAAAIRRAMAKAPGVVDVDDRERLAGTARRPIRRSRGAAMIAATREFEVARSLASLKKRGGVVHG